MPAPKLLKTKDAQVEVPKTFRKPTAKILRFIDLLIETDNATEAAKGAGYSEKSAARIGSALRRNRHVQKAIEIHNLDNGEGAQVDKTWLVKEFKACYRKFLRINSPAAAVRCLEQLKSLGGHDGGEKPPQKHSQMPGKNISGQQTSETSFDQMPTGEQIDVLRRTIERLAHGNGTAESPAGEK